jgi:hypothetical protein
VFENQDIILIGGNEVQKRVELEINKKSILQYHSSSTTAIFLEEEAF